MWATATCTIIVFPVQGRSREDHLDDRGAIKTGDPTIWCMNLGGSISAEHGASAASRSKDLEKRLKRSREAVGAARDPRRR